MKRNSILLFLLGLLLTGLHGYGQAPENDDYTGAVALDVNPDYESTHFNAGTTVGATQSPQSSCTTFNAHDDDVWYKFKASKGSHIIRLWNITPGEGSYTAPGIEVFKSDENRLTEQILCAYIGGTFPKRGEAVLVGLTVDETYFVRVYGYSSGHRINFNISILTPPNPPANDEPADATPLTANAGYDPVNSRAGTTDGATQSAPAACTNVNSNDDDVWYRFTATRASHIVRLSSISLAYGSYRHSRIEVFTSNAGGPDERILCSSSDATIHEGLLTGLTVNDTYFVRVYAQYSFDGIGDRINYDISILTPPNPPANDEPAGARVLTVNQDYTCTEAIAGTTEGATQSAPVACTGVNSNDDDVWYEFTATRASHIVRLSSVSLAYGDYRASRIEVFTSNAGAPGERILCSSAANAIHEGLLTGLTVDDTYFVRVYAQYSFNGIVDRINFNICLLSPVYPPANDEYTGAEELTVSEDDTCTEPVAGTTDGATKSAQAACKIFDNDDDVWYSFTATNQAHTVKLSDIAIAYGNNRAFTIEVLRKTGDTPGELILCESASQSHEAHVAGLAIGETYFVRIYALHALSGIADRINFKICVVTPALPANDECAAAVDISNGTQAAGTTNGATESLSGGACSPGYAYDVWYKVTPVSSGALTVNALTSDFDLVLEAFTGSCEALTSVACKNDGVGSESLTIADAVGGTTYYFRVYNYTPAAARVAAETGNFTIRVNGDALPVTLASFKASPTEGNSVRLDWTTTEEANASHFDIEHSLNGKEWSKIWEIKAAGAHTALKSYTYIHTNPSLSMNYYRLRSVDFDGSFSYSAIESIRLKGAAKSLTAYPNPVSDRLYLNPGKPGNVRSIQLYNASGIEVKVTPDATKESLDVSHLPAGVYLLKVDGANGVSETFRVVISK